MRSRLQRIESTITKDDVYRVDEDYRMFNDKALGEILPEQSGAQIAVFKSIGFCIQDQKVSRRLQRAARADFARFVLAEPKPS